MQLVAYNQKMTGLGFKVHFIPKSSLVEVAENVNYKVRLEIYDDATCLKIESRSDYKEADKPKHEMSLTLRTVKDDHDLNIFLEALKTHTPN